MEVMELFLWQRMLFLDIFLRFALLNLSNQFDEAKELNSILENLYELLFIESNPIPVKWILNKMERIQSGIRLPLVPL